MRFAVVDVPGRGTRVARVSSGDALEVLPYESLAQLLETPDLGAAEAGETVADARLRAPLSLGRVFVCAGLNYADHAREVGKTAPEFPTFFAKLPNSVISPDAEIRLPAEAVSTQVDWEAEVVIVIGRRVSRADADVAGEAIFGYTIVNDVSVRDWQRRTQEWLQGKNFDDTTPVGPWVVTADEFDPAEPHAVETIVNGVVKQSGSTDDMIFSPADLVSYVSQFMTLQPGDLIATGTPAGVGTTRQPPEFLQDGDELVTRIDGIGELRNVCRRAS